MTILKVHRFYSLKEDLHCLTMSWKCMGRPFVTCPSLSRVISLHLVARPCSPAPSDWNWACGCVRLTLNLCSSLFLLKGWDQLKCWSFLLGVNTIKAMRFAWLFLWSFNWEKLVRVYLPLTIFSVPGFPLPVLPLFCFEGFFFRNKNLFHQPFFLCRMESWDSRTDASFGS